MGTTKATGVVPLRRIEYERLVESGLLDDQRVELLDGRKVQMSPESAEHAATIDAIADQLAEHLGPAGIRARLGHPIALSVVDEPEPDVAVVDDRSDRYSTGHPTPAEISLLIEVAHRSLEKDLGEKATRYAAAGVAEYWVVDVAGRRTVVHRDPLPGSGRYASVETMEAGRAIEPIMLPRARITPL